MHKKAKLTVFDEQVMAQMLTMDKIESPFKAAHCPELFQKEFLKSVKAEVLGLDFDLKSNDLYHFHQSKSLVGTTLPFLSQLRDAIYSPRFIGWMSQMTGLELNQTIDLSAHIYPHNGYLLCHDDDIGSAQDARVIAFIIYLVDEDWNEADGGRLGLFDCDSRGQPGAIVKHLIPSFNSLAYFQVTPTSYHEVEMVTGGRDRVSISGWLHGPKPHYFGGIPESLQDPGLALLHQWIHPVYMNESQLKVISKLFLEESVVELRLFLIQSKYDALVEAWSSLPHSLVGPANARHYYVPDQSQSSLNQENQWNIMDSVKSLFNSDSFRRFVMYLTGLDTIGQGYSEFRRFEPMDYTLLHDHVVEPCGLDIVFSSCLSEPQTDEAGHLHYTSGADTLLSIPPACNSLHLVYRPDTETKRFVRRLTCDMTHRQDIIMTFPE